MGRSRGDAGSAIRKGHRTDYNGEQKTATVAVGGPVSRMTGVSNKGNEQLKAHPQDQESAAEHHTDVEETVQAAHAFEQSIIDGVAEPIMVIGADYRVKLMNRAAREFSAGSPKTAEPAQCYKISHQRDAPCSGVEHPCPLERVRQSGQPVTVVHEHHQADGQARVVEIIAAPLLGPDGCFQGIIESIRDITERRRAEEELRRYAGRLRSLTARLAEVAEKERQRLARELHDQVGQNLTALGINLNIIRAQAPEGMGALVQSRLEDSLALLEQTAERIRDLMADLRPPVLDDYGLVAALHWYGEQFTRRTGIAVTVSGEEPVSRPPVHVENALFRIAQEALTNVAKHAQASQVTLTVDLFGDALRLVVADDGLGFTPTKRAESEERGWGLLTMCERAQAVGGHCHVESYPGHGTRVVAEVPL